MNNLATTLGEQQGGEPGYTLIQIFHSKALERSGNRSDQDANHPKSTK
jgi:hypothetical protein